MPKGVYDRSASAEASTMFPVKLKKNYRPLGEFEVMGYDREAVIVKDAAGTKREVISAAFIPGEIKPAPTPGAGYPGKIWKGTHIKLPVDEARDVINRDVGERADAI